MNAAKIRLAIVALIAAIPLFNASANHIWFTNATINGVALETSSGPANPAITVQPNAPITFGSQAYNTSAGPTTSDTLAVTFAARNGSTALRRHPDDGEPSPNA